VESKYAIVNNYTQAYQDHQDRQRLASRRRTAERDGTEEVWRASNRGLDRMPATQACFAGAPETGIRAFRELYLDLKALPPNTLLSGTQALEPIFTPAAVSILERFNSYWLLRVAAEASRVQEKTSGQSLPINEASVAAALTALKADKNLVAAQELAAKTTSAEVRAALSVQGGLTLIDASGAEPKLVDNPVFA